MKAHLISSPTPLVERKDRTAFCGAVVPQASFVMFWDGDHVGMLWNKPQGVCAKCWSSDVGTGSRYIYGIVNGQELKAEQ